MGTAAITTLTSGNVAKIGVVVAAHAPLASSLLQTAQSVLGPRFTQVGENVRAVDIDAVDPASDAFTQMQQAISVVDKGHGVLVIADLFGGSAANLALAQLGTEQVEVVTGANLAMLLDALNARYAASWQHLSVEALAQKVARAAHGSVVVASALLVGGSNALPTDPAQAA